MMHAYIFLWVLNAYWLNSLFMVSVHVHAGPGVWNPILPDAGLHFILATDTQEKLSLTSSMRTPTIPIPSSFPFASVMVLSTSGYGVPVY